MAEYDVEIVSRSVLEQRSCIFFEPRAIFKLSSRFRAAYRPSVYLSWKKMNKYSAMVTWKLQKIENVCGPQRMIRRGPGRRSLV
jgi:hypothetical protein